MVADPSLGQVADPLIGQMLGGRYHVASRVARGGMGTVYVARDIKLGREVAIKVMHPEAARDEEFVGRFVGEAKAAAALSHPNVVAVYDQGFSDGHVYLVMEYVKGRTLRDLLTERGRIDPRQALSIMQPILAALGAAHRAGLVHRDVKPENVLLTDNGNVKVADFGLARAATASRQTKTGLIIGTVAYMAPEQVVNGTADARSDVYAAGIMLYELVTGAQPYQADTPLSVAYKHVNEVVPPPSRAVPGIPPQVDALVAAATAREPERRPANADQLLAALIGGVRTPVPQPGPPPGSAGAPTHNATAVMQIPQFPPGQSGPGGGPLGGGAPFGGPPTHPGQTMTVGIHRHDRNDESPLVNRILSAVTGRFVLIGIGVLAVAVLAWAIWYQTSGQYRTVPSVIGESVTQAKAELTSKGYKVVQGPSRFNDKIAKDAVVDMQPSPGSEATSGALITIFASRGMQPVSIPDLKGKSVADAQNTLQSLGLKFTNASEASKSVAPGSVTRTVPAAGQQAQPGVDTVTIYASSGVQVPNVVGQSQEQAKQTLQAAGFQVAINEQDPAPGQQPDIVLAQSPQQGSSAGAGALITLTATKHAPPQPGQPVAVPSVLGMNFAQAVAALQAAGLPVKHPDKPFDGPVTGQNPPPGTPVPAGTQIDIWGGGGGN